MRSAAAAYFATPNVVPERITAMQHAYDAGGAAAATGPGFVLLTMLGDAADAGPSQAAGTPAQGSSFANAVLACMSVAGYTSPIDFSADLGPQGLFAVRDGSGNAPVISRLVEDGAPAFGAEPSTGNWPLAGRTLFYGHKVVTSTLANETAAGTVFELSTLPSGLTFSPEIRTGVCEIDDPSARILHQHANDPGVILPPDQVLSFCPTGISARTLRRSPLGSFLRYASDLLTPRSALAAAFAPVRGGGGAGLVSGLSELGPVTFTSTVAITVPPQNTTRSADPQFRPIVTVRNTSTNGNALKGTTITLTVTTNRGNFTITGNTAQTDGSGIATFPNLHIDKPGGYLLTATSDAGGIATAKFQINGQ
jgi:hypothetical protein